MEKRVQKIISEAGIASRRKAEEFISQSRVSVNDKIISLGDKADPDKDVVKLDGNVVKLEKKVYFAFNKPENLISSLEENNQSILDYINRRYPRLRHMRVFHVGRLDFKTRGLMFLTNDGDFANYIMHPSNNVKKTYLVTTESEMSDDDVEKINLGFDVEGDLFKATCKKYNNGIIEIIIGYGKKSIIRRGIAQLGYNVIDLLRVKIGKVHLGNLEPGAIRELTDSEFEVLKYSRGKRNMRKKYSFNEKSKSKGFEKKNDSFRPKRNDHEKAFGSKRTYGKSDRSFSKRDGFRSSEGKSYDKDSGRRFGFDYRKSRSDNRDSNKRFSSQRSRFRDDNRSSYGINRKSRNGDFGDDRDKRGFSSGRSRSRDSDFRSERNRSDSRNSYRNSDRSRSYDRNFKRDRPFREDNQRTFRSKNPDRKPRDFSEDIKFHESKFYKRLHSDSPSGRGRDYKRHDDRDGNRPKSSFKKGNFSEKRDYRRNRSDGNGNYRGRGYDRDSSRGRERRDNHRSGRRDGSKHSNKRY